MASVFSSLPQSAVNGMVGIPGIAPYTCAKHGVVGLTQSVALEFAEKGVRVNALAPGYVDTPRMDAKRGRQLRTSFVRIIASPQTQAWDSRMRQSAVYYRDAWQNGLVIRSINHTVNLH